MVAVNQPTWRARMILNLDVPLHDLSKNPKRVLPKFDPKKGVSAEDHLKIFYMAMNILNVEYEDVVCTIFPYTFEPKASSCDQGGYWWPPIYSTWTPAIVFFSFRVSLIVAQFTIFWQFLGPKLPESF